MERKKEERPKKKVSDVNMSPTIYVPNDDSLFHEYVCVNNVITRTHLYTSNRIKYIYDKEGSQICESY